MGKKKKGAGAPEPPAASFSNNPFAALATKTAAARRGPLARAPEAAPPAPAATPGTPKVVVRREKKGRGGKTVTRVSGLPEAALAELATRMKRSLGCGAVVEGEDIVLLGSLVDRAASWLEAEGVTRITRAN